MPIAIPTMPAPTDAQLEALEQSVGVALPNSYVEFTRHHDGAVPEDNSLGTQDNEVGVARFIPVGEAVKAASGIEGFPANVILLAEDGCGNHFYVDPGSGAVHFWDHELEGPDERVADSALAFVDRLNPFDISRVKLAPGQDQGGWVDPSFKPEF
ncbi:SMI1/KNR4 family protein [Sphingomonas sp. CFBP 8765]|uniref:SMI1/KNR4 family protein n=1 Tax=Sphingomonas sp. CFBP 8765 TaxID=2775274 RepID=UPI00177B93DD|nr:SMI1/KNR4 family protein [Sphingomonas sp. CFBP 8765]MBD8469446.1 SMI1/KNR4 family protein [Sphingomonas sp. CFBP 8765]